MSCSVAIAATEVTQIFDLCLEEAELDASVVHGFVKAKGVRVDHRQDSQLLLSDIR